MQLSYSTVVKAHDLLRFSRHLFLLLLLPLLPLPLQKLSLVLCAHILQPIITHLLLLLLAVQSSLFRFLALIGPFKLVDLLFTLVAKLPLDLCAEVRAGCKGVWKAEEVIEDGQSR